MMRLASLAIESPLAWRSRRLNDRVITRTNDASWPASDRSPAIGLSHFSLLRQFERVVYFDAKVSNRALARFAITIEVGETAVRYTNALPSHVWLCKAGVLYYV